MPTELFAVPTVSPELEGDAGWLEDDEAFGDEELDGCELLPHAANRSDAPRATGMRNLLKENTLRLLSYVFAVSGSAESKTPRPGGTFPRGMPLSASGGRRAMLIAALCYEEYPWPAAAKGPPPRNG